MRAPQMLGAATILELLCAFTIYLDPVSAASRRANANGLSARANNAAGIGVEVECSQIRIRDKNNNQFTPEQLEKLKGQTMNPIGFDGGRKTNWKLTAEIVDKDLIPESIVDGIQNKVGAHKTKDIGKEISAFMVGYSRSRPYDNHLC